MRLGVILLAAVLAIPGSLLQGCGRACTKEAHMEGFHLWLVRPAWEPGEYLLEGTADGEPFACTMNSSRVVKCSPATVSFDAREQNDLVFSSNPGRVEVTVTLDGERLGEGSFRPDYLRDEPNGEGCGVRIFATETLELPGPTPCGVDESCRCVYDDGCGCGSDAVNPWPWSVCLPGTVPADACDPESCACAGTPPTCVEDCGVAPGRTRSVCVEGAWACPDPAFPVPAEDCG